MRKATRTFQQKVSDAQTLPSQAVYLDTELATKRIPLAEAKTRPLELFIDDTLDAIFFDRD
jgi:hypothetical protein